MTLQELIDQSIFIAGVQNSDAQAESLVPLVFQSVALKYAGTEEGRSLLRKTHTIAMTDGVGTLPDEVLTSCKFGASIGSSTDVTVGQTQTLVPYFQDFIQPRSHIDSQFNWWCISGNDDLRYLQPEEIYDPSDGFTGNLQFTCTSTPVVPATASVTIDAPEEFLSDAVQALAIAIKGANQVAA